MARDKIVGKRFVQCLSVSGGGQTISPAERGGQHGGFSPPFEPFEMPSDDSGSKLIAASPTAKDGSPSGMPR